MNTNAKKGTKRTKIRKKNKHGNRHCQSEIRLVSTQPPNVTELWSWIRVTLASNSSTRRVTDLFAEGWLGRQKLWWISKQVLMGEMEGKRLTHKIIWRSWYGSLDITVAQPKRSEKWRWKVGQSVSRQTSSEAWLTSPIGFSYSHITFV